MWNLLNPYLLTILLSIPFNKLPCIKLSEAADRLFNRDYKQNKQIFVPEVFITKTPTMIFNEKERLEQILQNPNLSEQEKVKWRCRVANIEGELLEKNVYDVLKKYFNSHKDQKVLILHGYEIMDLDTLERKDRFGNLRQEVCKWEKDFIVINLTYGYIMAIEAKRTLDFKSIKSAKEQLENTKAMIEKWFGADLKQDWMFLSAVYCEKGDMYKKLCAKCDDNFVFTSPDDLLAKLTQLHNELNKVMFYSKYKKVFQTKHYKYHNPSSPWPLPSQLKVTTKSSPNHSVTLIARG